MDTKEITTLLDVKLEAKEKNFELLNLRTWTNCFVKIEAVKCFPCYIKITFFKDSNDISKNSTITRINLPGLHVQTAKSRTKNYAYGLFWNNNRKRCTAFFGFETKSSCEWHMRWVKLAIENLELHRQEILQSRRMSRQLSTSMTESENADASRDFLMYQNLHDTQDIKDVNDILGPLPTIPPSNDANWSRRVSGMSGIYEEIGNPASRRESTDPRISIASGIYEEMRLPVHGEVDDGTQKTVDGTKIGTPPPLPPRTRVNTLESEIPRSLTNPESDTFEKYKNGDKHNDNAEIYAQFHFGNESMVVRRSKLYGFDIMENNRNSFSSPDLSKYQQYDSDTSLELNVSDNLSTKATDFNISDNIQSNFNFSCMNSSTINLIGSNVIDEDDKKVVLRKKTIKDDGGYCVMSRPTASQSGSESSLKGKSSNGSSSGFESMSTGSRNQQKADHCFDIQFRFDDVITTSTASTDISTEALYENMSLTNHYVEMGRYKSPDSSSVYDSPKRLIELNTSTKSDSSDSMKATNRKSMTVDDKIPSYYPNENFKPIKPCTVKPKAPENVYITTPTMSNRKYVKKKSPNGKTKDHSPARASVVIKNATDLLDDDGGAAPLVASKSCSEVPVSNSQTFSHRMYQKYATLSRASSKYIEKCSKTPPAKSENGKKFSSLPRFRKFDLSPLKIKISSVLQRNNSDF